MADKAEGPQPTASEAMFFFSIVKNMKSMAEIDWIGVAEDRGFKSAEVAKVHFHSTTPTYPKAADANFVFHRSALDRSSASWVLPPMSLR